MRDKVSVKWKTIGECLFTFITLWRFTYKRVLYTKISFNSKITIKIRTIKDEFSSAFSFNKNLLKQPKRATIEGKWTHPHKAQRKNERRGGRIKGERLRSGRKNPTNGSQRKGKRPLPLHRKCGVVYWRKRGTLFLRWKLDSFQELVKGKENGLCLFFFWGKAINCPPINLPNNRSSKVAFHAQTVYMPKTIGYISISIMGILKIVYTIGKQTKWQQPPSSNLLSVKVNKIIIKCLTKQTRGTIVLLLDEERSASSQGSGGGATNNSNRCFG